MLPVATPTTYAVDLANTVRVTTLVRNIVFIRLVPFRLLKTLSIDLFLRILRLIGMRNRPFQSHTLMLQKNNTKALIMLTKLEGVSRSVADAPHDICGIFA